MPDLDRDRELVERLRPAEHERERGGHLLIALADLLRLLELAEVGLAAPHGWGVRFEVERENGIIEGERHERADVVAWLRSQSFARSSYGTKLDQSIGVALFDVANAIERGAHVIAAGVAKPEAGAGSENPRV